MIEADWLGNLNMFLSNFKINDQKAIQKTQWLQDDWSCFGLQK